MGLDMIQRVTIMAVGVERYMSLPPLGGPRADVENLQHLLVTDSGTALFQDNQFQAILDPTSSELRSAIDSYVLGRSASGDILVFYFSGHGVPIGRSDFGFCTTDATMHPGANLPLPLSMLRFSDLLSSIALVGVVPVIVIDACYSGQAGKAIVPAPQAIAAMHQEIQSAHASNYALLCSCSDVQLAVGNKQGGLFSRALIQTLRAGLGNLRDSYTLTLADIFQPLSRFMEAEAHDSEPRLYMGKTFAAFPLARNIQFTPQMYSFVGHLKCVIDALWNNGKERELSPQQIHRLCGAGAYGNHQKLSLEPWNLVENVPATKKRRLTDRGRMFARGILRIPKAIQKDPVLNKWIPLEQSEEIDINSAES